MSLRHAILGVLHQGPMHGYQVSTELEQRIAGGRYNSAQVYQGLHWLAGRGFVAAAPPEPGLSRDRRPFNITGDGRREFKRWLRAPVVLARPTRDEAVIKMVFLGLHEPAQLVAYLERLKRQRLRRLAGSSKRSSRASSNALDAPLLAELTGAALRFREEAEVAWIDHCLERVKPIVTPIRECSGVPEEDKRKAAAGDPGDERGGA